ncbi:MAG: tRNA pseudouridine synthase A [Acidimicrobiales bacterium]|nr:tRNA pseudouridine synthase A [Acidimicrobiales bacterium]
MTAGVAAGAPQAGEAGRPDGRRRLKLVLAYDGTGLRGFAAQPGQRTVAGELSGAIERVAGHPVRLVCAGRTDAGVHAFGQVVHVDVDARVDPVRLQRSCNGLLSPAIVVRAAEVAPCGFDARRQALSRRYRYQVLNAPAPDPFLSGVAWHVPEPLDLRGMQAATDPLLGEHDFSVFCRRPKLPREAGGPEPGGPGAAGPGVSGPAEAPKASLVRRVLEASWSEDSPNVWWPVGEGPGGTPAGVPSCGRLLRFSVEANAFCHQMVRSMVGMLVAVGRGQLRAGEVGALVRSGDRGLAPSPAPPHGLCLWGVRYGPDGNHP